MENQDKNLAAYITPEEAAELMFRSGTKRSNENRVRKLFNAGILPGFKDGRNYWLKKDGEVDEALR